MGLRIIGGDLKRKKLHSPRGSMIRPSADRLRESIFNILSLRIQKTVVLDLFAGTGAFGIEALSRGAKFVVFIDKDQNSLSTIKRNIQSCDLLNKTKVIKWDIIKNLNCINAFKPDFNLVFMDPPYNRNIIQPALFNLLHSCSLKRGACIVIEHSVLEPIPKDNLEFKIADQRKYGKTLVTFLDYMV